MYEELDTSSAFALCKVAHTPIRSAAVAVVPEALLSNVDISSTANLYQPQFVRVGRIDNPA